MFYCVKMGPFGLLEQVEVVVNATCHRFLSRDASNSHFVLLDFVKSGRPAQPAAQLRAVPLKPCIYKRR